MTAIRAMSGDLTRRLRGEWRPIAIAVVVALVTVAISYAYKATVGGTLRGDYLWSGYSDIPPLWFKERLHEGAIPYLDHPVEYPVLTGLWMFLASIPASNSSEFFAWTTVLLAASAAVTAGLLAREFGLERALVFAVAPTLLISAVVNWDLPSVALATAGLVAHRRARDGWAGVWIGLGVAAKLWPGLLLLALVPAAWKLRGWRAAAATGGGAVGIWAAVNLPVAPVAPRNWYEFIRLNRERGIDWDPLWGILIDVTDWRPSVEFWNVATAALLVVLVIVIMVATVRRAPADRWYHAGLPLVAAFLLTNKVYSPQFSLWLLPVFAVTFPGWGWFLAFGIADVAVTLTRFPYLGNFVEELNQGVPWWAYKSALGLRGAILIAAAYVGWRAATSPRTDDDETDEDSAAATPRPHAPVD